MRRSRLPMPCRRLYILSLARNRGLNEVNGLTGGHVIRDVNVYEDARTVFSPDSHPVFTPFRPTISKRSLSRELGFAPAGGLSQEGESAAYLKVIWEDEEMTWTSPVWIDC